MVAEEEKPTGEFKNFRVIVDSPEAEMVEGFATGSAYLETIDTKLDSIDKKQDQMLTKQDETIVEIRGLRGDLGTTLEDVLDGRFERVFREISEIKARLGML